MVQVEMAALDGPKKGIWEVHSSFTSWGKPAAFGQAFFYFIMLQGLWRVRITEDGKVIWDDGFWV